MKNKKMLSLVFSAALLTSASIVQSNTVKASEPTKPANLDINKNTNTKGIVTASALNVRSNNSINSKVLTILKNNSSVEIVDTIGDWYKIKVGSSYGYTAKKYIKIESSKVNTQTTSTTADTDSNSKVTNVSTETSKQAVITASALNVRSDASYNSKVITILRNNTTVQVVSTIGDWHKIKVGSSYGYISKKYAAFSDATAVSSNTTVSKASSKTPEVSTNNLKTGIVTASALNVRADSSYKGNILTILRHNTSVEIVATVGDWYKIKSGTSYGYVAKQYIKIK